MRACIDGHRQWTAAATPYLELQRERAIVPVVHVHLRARPGVARVTLHAACAAHAWRYVHHKAWLHRAEAQRRGRGERSHRTFRVPTSTSCPYASDLIRTRTHYRASPKCVHERAGRVLRDTAGARRPLPTHSPQDRDDRRQVLRDGQRPIGRSRRRRRRLRAATCQALHRCEPPRVAARCRRREARVAA